MKRRILFIAALIMCISLFTSIFAMSASAATVQPPYFIQPTLSKVALCNLSFREGPSTAYTVIGILNESEYIYIKYQGSFSYPYEYGIPYVGTQIYNTFGVRDGYVKNPNPPDNNLF